jgi:hypothetical protein
MTAQDPLDGKDQSAGGTVAVYGLQGVRRARRMIAAGRRRQRRDYRPVEMDKTLEQGRCDGAHGLDGLPGAGQRPDKSGPLNKCLYLGAADCRAVLPRINDKNGIETAGKRRFGQTPALRYHTPGPVPGHRIAVLPDRHEDGPGNTGSGTEVVQAHAFDGTAEA